MSHLGHYNNLFDLISSFVFTGIIDIIDGYFGELSATIRRDKRMWKNLLDLSRIHLVKSP